MKPLASPKHSPQRLSISKLELTIPHKPSPTFLSQHHSTLPFLPSLPRQNTLAPIPHYALSLQSHLSFACPRFLAWLLWLSPIPLHGWDLWLLPILFVIHWGIGSHQVMSPWGWRIMLGDQRGDDVPRPWDCQKLDRYLRIWSREIDLSTPRSGYVY